MISSLDNSNKIILYAPRINTGGGYVLMKDFINNFMPNITYGYFDDRIRKNLNYLKFNKNFIKHNIISLLINEYKLFKTAKKNNLIICFHGLPPIFPVLGQIIVFAQLSLLFEPELFQLFPLKTKIRLYIERMWFKLFFRTNIEYLVQTPSMQKKLQNFLGDKAKINLIKTSVKQRIASGTKNSKKIYNFIYIASGEAHKNHINLLKAWQLLATDNIKPSLVLTIDKKTYPKLANTIEYFNKNFNLNITNIGQVDNIMEILSSSDALIFPSLTESLGLPLIEARELGIPVLASDKEFITDSIIPIQKFDPHSYQSIANAVKTFYKTLMNNF